MEKIHFKKKKDLCVKCFISFSLIITLSLSGSSLMAQPSNAKQDQELAGELSLADLFNMKITSASLRPQELREVPATTYIITEQDFKKYGYRDLKDILRNTPGIEYSYPNSHIFGGQRGFSSFWELTKLLINGREVNSLASSALFVINQFPLTGVRRVEIIQGPSSVLYGPEAFSGVINIVTKDIDTDTSKSELTAIGGGGDKSSWNINGAFHNATKKGDVSVAVNGYADCSKEPDYSDFLKSSEYSKINQSTRVYLLEHTDHYRDNDRNFNFNSDLVYSPNPNFTINTGAIYLRGETGGGSEAAQLSYRNGNIITEQMHVYAGSDYRFSSVPVKSSLTYHFILDNFYARFQNSQDMGDNPPPIAASNFEKNKLNALNFQTDFTPSFTDNYLIVGLGLRNTKLGEPSFTGVSDSDVTPLQPVSLVGRYLYPPTGFFAFLRPYLEQDRRYFYLQDQQNFWDKKIQITAGVRYDYNSIYGDVWNIRSGLLLRPLANYTIKVLFGQGFREPTMFELSNNPQLNPARINSSEVSLLFTPLKQISGQIAYFQNRANKLIEISRSPDGAFFHLAMSVRRVLRV
jgi:outer membrane receptor for ferrienterochelin and colicins